MKKSVVVAVAWYSPEDWPELKRLCPDLDDTHDQWLANAEAKIKELPSPFDEQIVKIILTADELRKWKRSTGREISAKVRATLAAKAARETNRTGQ
jgi:hypothetical protein